LERGFVKATVYAEHEPPDVLQHQEAETPAPTPALPQGHRDGVAGGARDDNEMAEAFAELERGVHAALETYSNVHRGSGHNSMVTTHLFEQARDIVLEYLGLNMDDFARAAARRVYTQFSQKTIVGVVCQERC
jgi:hypothetical protein